MARRKKSKKSLRNFLLFLVALLILGFIAVRYLSHRGYNGALELKELPEGFVGHGIDVSHHQGTIDWDYFAESCDSLISFVYCKATEGSSHVDSRWVENRHALIDHGIPHGAYHFYSPNTEALAQAKHFLAHYKMHDSDLPPVLDAETESKTDKQLISGMLTWLQHVEAKTGRRPVIYTSHHFYRSKFKGKFPGYKFWIANYNPIVEGLDDPAIICWQHSDNGNVPGIQGPVDMNFTKIEY